MFDASIPENVYYAMNFGELCRIVKTCDCNCLCNDTGVFVGQQGDIAYIVRTSDIKKDRHE